jgi:hypothetical protein
MATGDKKSRRKRRKEKARRRRKTSTPKKPRSEFVYIGFEEPDVNSEIKAAFYRREYEREGKDAKSVLVTPFHTDGRVAGNQETAWLRYDRMFVIDTNTKNGVACCVACMTSFAADDEGQVVVDNCELFYRGLSENPSDDPEMEAMSALVDRIQGQEWYDPSLRIGVVTDSSLGKHAAINRRELPFWRNRFLPARWDILYASADKKNDSILNKMINACDAEATEMLNRHFSKASTAPEE